MPGVAFTTTGNVNTLGAKMIEHAEAEVNKYLSNRYDISASTFQTSSSIPPLVRSLTEQLSEGYMWQHLSRGGAGERSVARGQELINNATANLQLIADYKMHLLDTVGATIADMSNTSYRVQSNTVDYTPTFAEDSEQNWAVDSDKLQDIATNRD
jgi:hypothetical protein